MGRIPTKITSTPILPPRRAQVDAFNHLIHYPDSTFTANFTFLIFIVCKLIVYDHQTGALGFKNQASHKPLSENTKKRELLLEI